MFPRRKAGPAALGKARIIPRLARLVQGPESFGDIEVGIIHGGDLVVMLLGAGPVAGPLGDATEAVVQGQKESLVIGVEVLEGFQIAAFGQLGQALGLERLACQMQGLNLPGRVGTDLLKLGDGLVVLAGAGEGLADWSRSVRVGRLELQAVLQLVQLEGLELLADRLELLLAVEVVGVELDAFFSKWLRARLRRASWISAWRPRSNSSSGIALRPRARTFSASSSLLRSR